MEDLWVEFFPYLRLWELLQLILPPELVPRYVLVLLFVQQLQVFLEGLLGLAVFALQQVEVLGSEEVELVLVCPLLQVVGISLLPLLVVKVLAVAAQEVFFVLLGLWSVVELVFPLPVP